MAHISHTAPPQLAVTERIVTPLKEAYLKGISKGAEPKLQAPDNNAIRLPAVVPHQNGNLTHVIGLMSLLRDTNWPVHLSG
jgi:hypothetical protein